MCKACLSGLECLWVYWKGREPSWKMGVITQLSGKRTVESWPFGLVGPPCFMLTWMCVTWLNSRAMTKSRFVGITPWPWGEWEKAPHCCTLKGSVPFWPHSPHTGSLWLKGSYLNNVHVYSEPAIVLYTYICANFYFSWGTKNWVFWHHQLEKVVWYKLFVNLVNSYSDLKRESKLFNFGNF